MVFFVCEGCNETLKKNQVDKHAYGCRSCNAVTCVDCQVIFYGNDYAAHITCVSEAEKYEKSLYKGKKEKANPQDAWMELIASCAATNSGAPPPVQRIIERLAETANVPRNKAKFGNFIKNSLKVYSEGLINDTWSYLEKVKTPQAPPAVAEVAPLSKQLAPEQEASESRDIVESGDIIDTNEKKKKKKRKDRDHMDEAAVAVEEDEVGEVDETEGIEKKKKKKKEKRQERGDEDTNREIEEENASSGTSEKKKKKKRRKESETEEM